jgi:pimeloyl-ACP methyl ester carboxylesterase
VVQTYLDKRARPDHVEAFAKVMKHMTNPDTRIRYNTMRRLKHILVPTLVVWGSEDKTNDISMAHDLAGNIPGAKLIVYEGIGHGVPQEVPDRFTADVLAFLRE